MKSILKILLLSISLFICSTIQGEEKTFKLHKSVQEIGKALIECVYQYTTITPIDTACVPIKSTDANPNIDLSGKIIERSETILQASTSVSKFWDYNSFKKDSIIFTTSNPLTLDQTENLDYTYKYMIKDMFVPIIVKNFPKDKFTVIDEIAPNDYKYEEPSLKLQWKLTNDTITICGYLCEKAVTDFGGRRWTVWYTSEIAVGDGPWKLCGLPGLILKATDESGIHTFEATLIRKSNHPIYITKNDLIFNVRKKVFTVSKKKLESHQAPVTTIHNYQYQNTIMTIDGGLFINGKRVKRVRVAKYEPLEME